MESDFAVTNHHLLLFFSIPKSKIISSTQLIINPLSLHLQKRDHPWWNLERCASWVGAQTRLSMVLDSRIYKGIGGGVLTAGRSSHANCMIFVIDLTVWQGRRRGLRDKEGGNCVGIRNMPHLKHCQDRSVQGDGNSEMRF